MSSRSARCGESPSVTANPPQKGSTRRRCVLTAQSGRKWGTCQRLPPAHLSGGRGAGRRLSKRLDLPATPGRIELFTRTVRDRIIARVTHMVEFVLFNPKVLWITHPFYPQVTGGRTQSSGNVSRAVVMSAKSRLAGVRKLRHRKRDLFSRDAIRHGIQS